MLQANRKTITLSIAGSWFLAASASALAADNLAPGVRGLATRAPVNMKIDGDLSEFKDAFCTPVEYFHQAPKMLRNRAAQFFYMWDDEAFYSGLRTLDEKPADLAADDRLWEGDAVEWYFDTRRGDDFRGMKWGPGAVHCYWTGFKGEQLQGRFCLRPGYLDAIPKIGVEVGVRKTSYGAEVEFKLPWANFPDFTPAAGEVIAVDAECCYSDGGPRVFRSFAYGSPLSVQQPASLGKVQLVDKLQRSYLKQCGPVMMPIHCDTRWGQPKKNHAHAFIALPPNHLDMIGKIVFRLTDLDGKIIGEYSPSPDAPRDVFEPEGDFARAYAEWPTDVAPPGGHHVTAIIYDQNGAELTRVAPRLVSVNMETGY